MVSASDRIPPSRSSFPHKEKEITESEINEKLSNLKTTEETERGKGNMNAMPGGDINNGEEKIMTPAEMRGVSPLYAEWEKKSATQRAEAYAKIALVHYNGQNGTNYELHEVVKSCSSGGPALYFHMNFVAKSSDSETSVMFFAELARERERSELRVRECCLLDPVSGMKSGCEFCGHDMHHPTNEMLSNLKTTEENERGNGNMNEEKEITESEINEKLSNMGSSEERDEFLASPIYLGWMRKRNLRLYEDCAKIGLTQYNEQNETNFKLDKVSCANYCLCPGIVYFHLNFIAESSNGSNDEKKRYAFFAEVADKVKVVSICCILDPVAGMDSGCRFCRHKVYHPRGYSFLGCRRMLWV